MISSHPRTEPGRLTRLLAVGVACLLIGFLAGQVTPNLLDALARSRAAAEPAPAVQTGALTRADDYATRHLVVPAAPLTRADDYATRHLSGAATSVLTDRDDYGTRHRAEGATETRAETTGD